MGVDSLHSSILFLSHFVLPPVLPMSVSVNVIVLVSLLLVVCLF